MATLEQRIEKLESATSGVRHSSRSYGACVGPFFTERGNKSQRYLERLRDPVERGLADFLVTFNHSHDPFAHERYRGRVPDRVLAAIYNGMRNYAFQPDVALRVRQLAGCVDDNCQLLPGYVLHTNGCITDAEPQVAGACP